MSHHDDFWTVAFFAGAAFLVLFGMWRGWRLGFVRQSVSILALVASFFGSRFCTGFVRSVLRPFLSWPEHLLTIASATLAGLVIYLAILLVGAVLFKKTSQQSVGLVRFGYGVTGAILGGIYGIFLVWALIVTVRVLGSVAEAQTQSRQAALHHSGTPASRRETPAALAPEPMIASLSELKNAIEQSPASGLVQSLDPLPRGFYKMLQQIGEVTSDGKSIARFTSYPGVQPLMNHPKVIALQKDPEIARAVAARDYLALVRNARIIALVSDAEVSRLLQKVDLEKALDYAAHNPENEVPRPADLP